MSRLAALAAALGFLAACAPVQPPAARVELGPPPPGTNPEARAARPPGAGHCASGLADAAPLAVIRPDEPVPDFCVRTTDGALVDSADLVGREPFAFVFFASWCHVCEAKLPVVAQAIASDGAGLRIYGVALDEPETWDSVAPFLDRFAMRYPIVRGANFERFALGYNPSQSIPVVVVVGRNGYVVDFQVGMSPYDYPRLVGAFRVARGDAAEVKR